MEEVHCCGSKASWYSEIIQTTKVGIEISRHRVHLERRREKRKWVTSRQLENMNMRQFRWIGGDVVTNGQQHTYLSYLPVVLVPDIIGATVHVVAVPWEEPSSQMLHPLSLATAFLLHPPAGWPGHCQHAVEPCTHSHACFHFFNLQSAVSMRYRRSGNETSLPDDWEFRLYTPTSYPVHSCDLDVLRFYDGAISVKPPLVLYTSIRKWLAFLCMHGCVNCCDMIRC